MSYIFVHGLGQTASSWEKTVQELNVKSEVFCPDLFGLCREGYSYERLYKTFVEYCNTFSEPLDVCGLSLGAVLALNYAIEYPQNIRSLVLVGAQYQMPKTLLMFQNFIFKLLPEKVFQGMGLPKKDVIALTQSMVDLNFKKDLSKVTAPVLVLCGAKDGANMGAARELSQLLSQARLEIVQGAGHEVNVDAPELLAKALSRFWGI